MSACPACGEPLYGWLLVDSGDHGGPRDSVVLERCERCGLGVAADLAPAELASALLGSARADLRTAGSSCGSRTAPASRPRSGAVTGRRWSRSGASTRPRVAAAAGRGRRPRVEELALPAPRPRPGLDVADDPQRVHLPRQLRPPGPRRQPAPRGAVGRLKFGIDAVVTVLAALPVALVSVPLELFAALGRPGRRARGREPGRASASG